MVMTHGVPQTLILWHQRNHQKITRIVTATTTMETKLWVGFFVDQTFFLVVRRGRKKIMMFVCVCRGCCFVLHTHNTFSFNGDDALLISWLLRFLKEGKKIDWE